MPQIASELNIPTSTLRYRIAPYRDFIPCESTSKGDRYSDESVLIMKTICTYYNDKKTSEEIMLILSANFARDIEIVNETNKQVTSEQQPNFIELVRLNDNLEKLIDKMDRQQELQIQINEIRTAIGELSRVERHKKGFWSRLWG